MSTNDGLTVDEGIRTMLLLMPRLIGRAKRLAVPDELRGLDLAPRHLSLLAYLLFDGPLGVGELASRLEVAPTTASLLAGELSRKGVLERREDDHDRRRTIVAIADGSRAAVEAWVASSAEAWRTALAPLTAEQRAIVIRTLRVYEEAVSE
jgi:DNA-binding MarR family transcriptional regulator